MANYLSLEEAAKKLGIPTDRLVELRSQGEVRGFRDGASWKFPDNEIDRLSDELPHLSGGDSGIIGGDVSAEGGGSDVEIGGESISPGAGSDVNLVPSESEGSDVAIVASDSDVSIDAGSDLLEIDSGELQLNDPAVAPGDVDLAMEPNAGSTGPVTDAELQKISQSHPDVLSPESDQAGSGSGSDSGQIELGSELDDIKLNTESDLSFSGPDPDDDSGEEILGAEEDSAMDVLGSDIGSGSGTGSGSGNAGGSEADPKGASSLEMLGGKLGDDNDDAASDGGRGADVLSELDLLSAEQQGSGLITGDSENLMGSSGLGSSIGADQIKDSDLGGLDDALSEDDDLVIADDDDDLVISSAGSDISIAGDSGINLMSPSDSGLSLESEPLDLAGSSISALDLGAELSEGGSSASGSGSDGSMVDFQADEEFQLSPSSSGLDADVESGSQVIEVEDSEAMGEPVEFGDTFEAEPVGDDALALEGQDDKIAIDETASGARAPAATAAYEVPFTLLQCVTLAMILCVLGLGGMLMTDLVRNMWSYTEPAAPVSSLTDSLIGLMGW